MALDTWTSKQHRDAFFVDLRDLLAKYPNIAGHMAREYENDPTNPAWSPDESYDRFNPRSPMIVQGIVLIVSHANLEHYEDVATLSPFEQSTFMTQGLLSKASSSWGLDPIEFD